MKRYQLLLLCTTLAGAVSPLTAQTSSTPVIGFYKFDVPGGVFSGWTCGFVAKKDFQGAMSNAVAGANIGNEPTTVITQTGAAWTSSPTLSSTSFPLHYVEILSGPQAGRILDIVGVPSATQVQVKGTFTGTTQSYCIRKHATLASVFNLGGGLQNSDEVYLYSDKGQPVGYFYDSGDFYGNDDPFTPIGTGVIIYPGQGFLIKPAAARQIVFGGGELAYIKEGVTRVPLYPGVPNLVGLINPLVSPPQQIAMGSMGFNSGSIADEVDQILPMIVAGGKTTLPYTLFKVGPDVFDDSDPFNAINSTLLPAGIAMVIKPASGSTIKEYAAPPVSP